MLRASLLLTLVGCGRIAFDPATRTDAADTAPPDPSSIAKVAGGGLDTCARTHGGDLYCWGLGDNGHLGDGMAVTRPTPRRVPVPFAFVDFDINDAGVCAITTDGTTYCWGLNSSGSLGVGHGSIVYSPDLVVTPTPFEVIALGFDNACVRQRDGTVSCAGRADLVGTQTGVDQPRFEALPAFGDVVDLSSGDNFTCALLAAGNVTCWGGNDFGQLGDGSMTPRQTPAAGPAGPYVQISAGDHYTCARRATGSIDCWGRNDDGELGDTTRTTRATPAPVEGITDAIDIATGSFTACALHASGTVSCWGDNTYGNVGDGTMGGVRTVPVPTAISEVVDIGARTSRHVCALTTSGEVYCWGDNADGQIGSPTLDDDGIGGIASLPTRVEGLPN